MNILVRVSNLNCISFPALYSLFIIIFVSAFKNPERQYFVPFVNSSQSALDTVWIALEKIDSSAFSRFIESLVFSPELVFVLERDDAG